jgi:hypothetical protein
MWCHQPTRRIREIRDIEDVLERIAEPSGAAIGQQDPRCSWGKNWGKQS